MSKGSTIYKQKTQNGKGSTPFPFCQQPHLDSLFNSTKYNLKLAEALLFPVAFQCRTLDKVSHLPQNPFSSTQYTRHPSKNRFRCPLGLFQFLPLSFYHKKWEPPPFLTSMYKKHTFHFQTFCFTKEEETTIFKP
jgi:hypothetical protein